MPLEVDSTQACPLAHEADDSELDIFDNPEEYVGVNDEHIYGQATAAPASNAPLVELDAPAANAQPAEPPAPAANAHTSEPAEAPDEEDACKGLEKAVSVVFPQAEPREYVRHLY